MITTQVVIYVFAIMLAINTIIEVWLDLRNKKSILNHRNAVPEKFKESLSLEDHQKAADYSVTKINFGMITRAISLALLLGWLYGGGLNALDELARSFGFNKIVTGLIFFGIFGVISFVLSMPASIYSTFVIEEKFGFNKTDAKTFIGDIIKGIVLAVLIGAPVLYGILWIMDGLGKFWWAYAWAFLSGFQLLLMWVYPTFIAPLFNKFSTLDEGETKDKILNLLDRTGFKSSGLFVMDASKRSAHGNAYFTGFGKTKRIVFFDNLLKNLHPSEVEAVLAHELGHFKRKHILKKIVLAFVMSFIGFYILGAVFHWDVFYQGHGIEKQSNYMALALFSIVSGIYTFLLTPISSLSSRKHEFEADEFAANHASAGDLITALVKLYKDNASTLTPDPIYSAFYHSHPPAFIRVNHLESLQK